MTEVSRAAIVGIRGTYGQLNGTGFVVADRNNEALVLTCAHVVQDVDAQKRQQPPPDRVTVVFQKTRKPWQTTLERRFWLPTSGGDVAVLRLGAKVQPDGRLAADNANAAAGWGDPGALEGVRPLALGSAAGTFGHAFNTFGYPDVQNIEGLPGAGKVSGAPIRAGDGAEGATGPSLLPVEAALLTK